MSKKLREQILCQTTQLILAVSHIVLLLSKKFLGTGVDKLLSTLECQKSMLYPCRNGGMVITDE